MNDRRFALLSERQKQCLRLYYPSRDMKEVGLELGLATQTVKKYLHEACQILETNRSVQAARLFVEYERDTLGISPPRRLADIAENLDGRDATESMHTAVRNRLNLGFLMRIGMMIAIAFGALALAGSLMVSASAITRFFEDHKIDISDPPYRQ